MIAASPSEERDFEFGDYMVSFRSQGSIWSLDISCLLSINLQRYLAKYLDNLTDISDGVLVY